VSQEKRDRQRENRQKRLEAERKAARAKALRRRITQVVILFVIVVIVLGINSLLGGDDEAATTTSTSTTTASTSPTTTSTAAATSDVQIPAAYDDYRTLPVACGGTLPNTVDPMTFDAPEDQAINPSDRVVATIVTSCGDIVLELDPAAAPETVNSFVFLARQGYYTGQAFHRIVEGFMLQGGDPTATGTGNPGYLLPDELASAVSPYPKGTLAMGNSGVPGSAGSQFFIMFEDYPLGPSYSVFGKTVDSDATMDAIEALPKEYRGGELSVPMEGLFIERIDVEVTP
jgi:cyclophilin family peptidyl-prolyl cis-trans isomerase